ncbi:membrane-associated protein, putative [Bodo saltans]|uniref:Membrane-associated protein, putative n=1 Tax=Bodo saltans TaxID=75058 RepID=A0A0S4JKC2_BODSA|nr:membrane-associated protein, putative [Bodo saltans]|eukprot:CUG90613.1 membrane-associated protein, putative [Bodo saltans]
MASEQCVATCEGFTTLRSACISNPCYADNLCKLDDPSIANCAEWCCESSGGFVFFAIFLAALGAFLFCYAQYLKRLHEENVESGAVTSDGKRVGTQGGAVADAPQATKRFRAVFTSSGGSLTPAR